MADKKQVVFTNEILYERNISDRVWPRFLQAQIDQNLQEALLSTKMYFLFTQQWYQRDAKVILTKIRAIETFAGKPSRASQLKKAAELRKKAWVDLENIWCDISNNLENYGIFKKNYTKDSHGLALPTR